MITFITDGHVLRCENAESIYHGAELKLKFVLADNVRIFEQGMKYITVTVPDEFKHNTIKTEENTVIVPREFMPKTKGFFAIGLLMSTVDKNGAEYVAQTEYFDLEAE